MLFVNKLDYVFHRMPDLEYIHIQFGCVHMNGKNIYEQGCLSIYILKRVLFCKCHPNFGAVYMLNIFGCLCQY